MHLDEKKLRRPRTSVRRVTRSPGLIPLEAELAYTRKLVALVRRTWKQIARDVLPLVAKYRAPSERQDALNGQDLVTQVGWATIRTGQEVPEDEAKGYASMAARQIEMFNERTQARLVEQVKGVDVMTGRPDLHAARDAFMADNVKLIKSIPETMHDRVAQHVRKAMAEGTRHEQLAKTLQAELGIGERRAQLIARDQVNKYNGKLAEARQTAAGFTHYKWITAGDERVRDSHMRNQGRVFAWASPPDATGNPGEQIRCRCAAVPLSERELATAQGEGRIGSKAVETSQDVAPEPKPEPVVRLADRRVVPGPSDTVRIPHIWIPRTPREEVEARIQAVEMELVAEPHEFMAGFDRLGLELWRVTQEQKSEVYVERRLFRSAAYVTHNQPSGSLVFSPDDVYEGISAPNLQGLRTCAPNAIRGVSAVGRILRPQRGWPYLMAEYSGVVQEFNDAEALLVESQMTKKFATLLGKAKGLDASHAPDHFVMRRVAWRLGIRYDIAKLGARRGPD